MQLARALNLTPEEIERYAPYHTTCAFELGYRAYNTSPYGRTHNPYHPNSVAAQDYDRGAECAMRRAAQAYRAKNRIL